MMLFILLSNLFILSFIMLFSLNTFVSLLYLVLFFINCCLVMFIFGFEYMAIITLLVYIGALAVLFLFVIMILDIQSVSLNISKSKYNPFIFFVFFAFIISFSFFSFFSLDFFYTNNSFVNQLFILNNFNMTELLSYFFYYIYTELFIIISLLLTVALIGSLVIVS